MPSARLGRREKACQLLSSSLDEARSCCVERTISPSPVLLSPAWDHPFVQTGGVGINRGTPDDPLVPMPVSVIN